MKARAIPNSHEHRVSDMPLTMVTDGLGRPQADTVVTTPTLNSTAADTAGARRCSGQELIFRFE